jgi:Domain of unknown function (DUF4304)
LATRAGGITGASRQRARPTSVDGSELRRRLASVFLSFQPGDLEGGRLLLQRRVINSLSTMDSSDVNKMLRDTVWPALKVEGFERRTTRTAWRDRPDQVDVVNFQSFNAYNAAVLNVTTYSFQINLAIHPRCRTTPSTPTKDRNLRPQEYACDFRHQLQGIAGYPGTSRAILWPIREDGSDLATVVQAATQKLLDDGMPWFRQLDGIEALLGAARETPMDMSATWGMGNFGSPHRVDLVASLEEAARAL